MQILGTTNCECEPLVQACHFDPIVDGCVGTCPSAGDKCEQTSPQFCECVGPTCGGPPAADGTCGGLCPDPTEICDVGTAGGCECLIPKLCESTISGQGFCGGVCPPNFTCDDDAFGLPCKCFPTFLCGDPVDSTCAGICAAGQCMSDPALGCRCL